MYDKYCIVGNVNEENLLKKIKFTKTCSEIRQITTPPT
nr:hypothetical protein [uncultured bacterium]